MEIKEDSDWTTVAVCQECGETWQSLRTVDMELKTNKKEEKITFGTFPCPQCCSENVHVENSEPMKITHEDFDNAK